MENTTKFLEQAVYIFMFCLAGTLLLSQNRGLNNLITTTKNEINKQNTYYEQSYDVIDNSRVSYAELISTLFGELDYDIQINNMTILKENYNYQKFDFSAVPQGEYTKSYEYDSSGDIVKIIYKS